VDVQVVWRDLVVCLIDGEKRKRTQARRVFEMFVPVSC
jgi:hypothetical protein